MPIPSSALPPSLRGLDLDELFAAGLHNASGSSIPRRWAPPASEDLALFFTEYEIVRLLGHGAMGAVYEAWEAGRERRVAIKVLPQEMGADESFAERFRREARTLAGLQHPHIVAVHETGETLAGHLFFVMEYVEGETLAHRLARMPPLPLGEALGVLAQCCDALSYAHGRGVVHRDIKPSNLLLTASGEVKIADFGLAALGDADAALEARLTLTGAALGTLEYAAPEQLSGRGGPGPQSDVYSLGVIAYELLAGRVPRGVFDPPSHVNPDVDPALDAVVLTALQSDPARRYASAEALRAALEQAQDVRANRAARERELRRQLLRRARLAGGLAALASLALGAAAFGWWQYRAAREHEKAAQRQSARAAASREDAEELTAFLTERFIDELRDGGRTGLIEQVVSQAERYFRELPPEDLGPASRERLAQVHLQRAFVERMRGNWEGAVAQTRAAITLANALAAEQPGSAARLTAAATARTNLTVLQMIRQQYEPALIDRRHLREMLAAARNQFHGDDGIALLHARAWRLEGEALLNLNRLEEAKAAQLEAMRHTEALAARTATDGGSHEPATSSAREPLRDRVRAEQSLICSELGSITERRRDLPGALGWFQRGLELYRPLVRAEEWSLEHRYALCGFIARVASIQIQSSDFAAAEETVSEAFPLVEQIEARTPGGTSALFQRRHLFSILARATEGQGRPDEAASAQTQANAADQRLRELQEQRSR